MDKLSLRSYIKTRSLLGSTATEIHNELVTAYGSDVVSYSTVALWFRRFSNGRNSFEDNPRIGRPITTITAKIIDDVQDLVREDPHITIDYIADFLQISHGSVFTIVKQHLKLRKISSRWVPHELTAAQRRLRVEICINNLQKFESGDWRLGDIITGDESWFYHRKIGSKQASKAWVAEGQPPPTLVRRQQNEQKTMFVIFFMTTGSMLIHYLSSGTSINAVYCRDECLERLVKNLCEKRPSAKTRGIKLHHDNARPHVSNIVLDYLRQAKVNIMAHPPYSPDLAPSDFWLFQRLKRSLDSYSDARSLAKAITKEVNSIDIDEYRKTFKKWLERMKLCVEHESNYFEHLM